MGDSGSLNMSGTETGHYDDFEDDCRITLNNIKVKLNCHDEDEITAERLKREHKDVLVGWLVDFIGDLKRCKEFMRDLRGDLDTVKTELIVSQRAVIKLQTELLQNKSNQLTALQSTVQSTVQETVQAGIKSYSEALTHNVAAQNTAVSPMNLKEVVRDVVDQEDRSRNIMIFGLKEDDGEHIDDTVEQVLQRIGEKPTFEAIRFGKKRDGKERPVKVTLRNCSAVHQILAKAKNLRADTQLKTVYISPDRSLQERTEHKQLVVNLRELVKKDPDRRHYIRNGRLISEVKA